MITVDVTELALLSKTFGTSQLRMVGKAEGALLKLGTELKDAWKANASTTAGKHGKWYPSSIQARPAGLLKVEVGPRETMRQGGMSFEFGSAKQPPHLDGQRALDALMPTILTRLETLTAEAL